MFPRIRHGEANYLIYLFPDKRTPSAQLKNFSYCKIVFLVTPNGSRKRSPLPPFQVIPDSCILIPGACPTMSIFDVTENENMGLAAKGRSPSQRVQALIFIFSSEAESLS